ncbi:MAG TPA: YaeQ family protein [Burkholderiaceae bacterium]|nr:YaeQ family protein [Burkholderiaceae bacterium]
MMRSMARGATIFTFDIDLADADRGVYERLALRVAQHPSEATDFLLTRVLAYCLELTEGIGFSSGLCNPDEPAIFVRDATGAYRSWIDIGVPEAKRLHRAAKAAERVAVYTHKPPEQLRKVLTGARIFRAQALHLVAVDRQLIARWMQQLQRRSRIAVSVSGGRVYLATEAETIEGTLEVLSIAEPGF